MGYCLKTITHFLYQGFEAIFTILNTHKTYETGFIIIEHYNIIACRCTEKWTKGYIDQRAKDHSEDYRFPGSRYGHGDGNEKFYFFAKQPECTGCSR